MKLGLLTNATVVDDTIRFVTANTKNKRAVAACGFETAANQRNDMQSFNLMNDDLQDDIAKN
jgi:hypothetical protein